MGVGYSDDGIGAGLDGNHISETTRSSAARQEIGARAVLRKRSRSRAVIDLVQQRPPASTEVAQGGCFGKISCRFRRVCYLIGEIGDNQTPQLPASLRICRVP